MATTRITRPRSSPARATGGWSGTLTLSMLRHQMETGSSRMNLVAAVGLCAGLMAQTYIVDKRGGGNFTDLPQAIAAVPSGAILRVREGNYSGFSIQNKSISILGDEPGNLAGGVNVRFTADPVIGPTSANDTVILRGLRIRCAISYPGGTGALRIAGAAGPVYIDRTDLASGGTQDAKLVITASQNNHFMDSPCAFPGMSRGIGSSASKLRRYPRALSTCASRTQCRFSCSRREVKVLRYEHLVGPGYLAFTCHRRAVQRL